MSVESLCGGFYCREPVENIIEFVLDMGKDKTNQVTMEVLEIPQV